MKRSSVLPRIVLTRRPAEFELSGRAFAIVAPGYVAPVGLPVIPIGDILARPERHLASPGTMVVVGLSRLMSPSNRVCLGRALLRPRPGIERISVDDVLFVSEPWRAWWHFRAVGADAPWRLTDSFLAETRWRTALETGAPDPFSADAIVSAARGMAVAPDPFRFPTVEVEVRPVSAEVRAEYAREKELAFEHERTVAAIVRRLSSVAQGAEPKRSIPSTASLWRRPPERIVRTDLPVDEWLVGQLLDRMATTNAVADGLSELA